MPPLLLLLSLGLFVHSSMSIICYECLSGTTGSCSRSKLSYTMNCQGVCFQGYRKEGGMSIARNNYLRLYTNMSPHLS